MQIFSLDVISIFGSIYRFMWLKIVFVVRLSMVCVCTPGDNVFVTTDHMGEPMPLNMVVQNLQVTLTEYNVKIHEQSKVLAYVKVLQLECFARGMRSPLLIH